MELVHLASLYHDDVMDEATMRRNVESVNSRFGNLVAIVAGDFLLARSAEIAAGLGVEIAALLAATLGELCQGQVAEVRAAFRVDRSRDDYSSAIAGKTASLMATSCRIGALTGGLTRPEVDAFTDFGRCFGMIFQVRDDILDVVGTEAELGKPAGQDLAEGIYTLPVLLTLADPVHGPELRDLLGQPLGLPEQEKARSIVAGSGAIAESVQVARGYADDAAAAAHGRTVEGAGRGVRPSGPLPGRRPPRRLSHGPGAPAPTPEAPRARPVRSSAGRDGSDRGCRYGVAAGALTLHLASMAVAIFWSRAASPGRPSLLIAFWMRVARLVLPAAGRLRFGGMQLGEPGGDRGFRLLDVGESLRGPGAREVAQSTGAHGDLWRRRHRRVRTGGRRRDRGPGHAGGAEGQCPGGHRGHHKLPDRAGSCDPWSCHLLVRAGPSGTPSTIAPPGVGSVRGMLGVCEDHRRSGPASTRSG